MTAARSSAANWRKRHYQDDALEVPENKRYLVANSASGTPLLFEVPGFLPGHPNGIGHHMHQLRTMTTTTALPTMSGSPSFHLDHPTTNDQTWFPYDGVNCHPAIPRN